MSITVDDGTLVLKDPSDVKTYTFDWDAENLPSGVTISSQTTTVTALEPSTSDTALTVSTSGSGLGVLTGSRKVGVRLSAGTLGQKYQVTNEIVTSETPAQTKQRSFFVLVEHL